MDGFNNQPTNNGMSNGMDQRGGIPNWNSPIMPPWMFYNNPAMNNPWFNNQGNNLQMVNEPARNTQTVPSDITPIPSINPNRQSTSRQTIPCGIVSNLDEIKPGEIPMDGGIGMFILNDLSEICIKRWNSDGKIDTRKYIEYVVEESTASKSNTSVDMLLQGLLDSVNERFERVEKMISDLTEVSSTKKLSSSKKISQKTEVRSNE